MKCHVFTNSDSQKEVEAKLSKIYYSPQGYWKDIAAIKTHAAPAKVSEMAQKMADTPSPLANLSSFPKTHFSPQIPCAHARQTFFFFRTTLWGVAGTEKHTNTLWPSSMWPAVLKRLNCWPPKNRLRCQALFRKFTNAGLWNGHSFCKWILDANSLVLSPRRSKNTHQTFEAGIPSSVVVRYLYQPGELEGGRKRASHPIWNCTTSKKPSPTPNEPILYYLKNGPKRGFVCGDTPPSGLVLHPP